MYDTTTATMTTDRDRLLAANAIAHQFLSEEQLAAALEQWPQYPGRSLVEVIVQLRMLSAAERDNFEAMVEQRLSAEPNKSAALTELARRAVEHVAPTVKSNRIRAFLTRTRFEPDRPANHVAVAEHLVGATDYELESRIGQGGIGEVWRCRDVILGRVVAIKRMRAWDPQAGPQTARFLAESKITARLQHPNIISVHQVWRHPVSGEPMFAMDLVEGETLDKVIDDFHQTRHTGNADPLALARLISRFATICRTIAFAHQHGVIHRDLKPANVMVGEYGKLLVLDWGLAKLIRAKQDEPTSGFSSLASPAASVDGEIIGSPVYMSPEQASGRPDLIDERTDIFGLGAILFQMLFNRPPYDLAPSTPIQRALAQAAGGEVDWPAFHRMPRGLVAICHKTLATEKEKRYQSVETLNHDIENWLGRQPISVLPESPLQQLARWAIKHRTWTSLAGIAFMLFLLGGGSMITSAVMNYELVYHLETDAVLDKFAWIKDDLNAQLRDQSRLAQSLAQAPTTIRYLETRNAGSPEATRAKDDLTSTIKAFYESFPEFSLIGILSANRIKRTVERITRIPKDPESTRFDPSSLPVAWPTDVPFDRIIAALLSDHVLIHGVPHLPGVGGTSDPAKIMLRTMSLIDATEQTVRVLAIDRDYGIHFLPHADDQFVIFYDRRGETLNYAQIESLVKPATVKEMLARLDESSDDRVIVIPLNEHRLFCATRIVLRAVEPTRYLHLASVVDLSDALEEPVADRTRLIAYTVVLLVFLTAVTYVVVLSIVRLAHGRD